MHIGSYFLFITERKVTNAKQGNAADFMFLIKQPNHKLWNEVMFWFACSPRMQIALVMLNGYFFCLDE